MNFNTGLTVLVYKIWTERVSR